jgi:uracil-DNA glycosylase
MTKKSMMALLNEQIKTELSFQQYYTDDECKPEFGWGAAGKIMFVGQNPSWSNKEGKRGDSEFDKRFLELVSPLDRHDFYFTNLIKFPADLGEMEDTVFKTSLFYLKEEIAIVEPKIIITLGNKAKEWVEKLNISFFSVYHPSSIKYGSITEVAWQKKLNDILSTYKLLTKGN